MTDTKTQRLQQSGTLNPSPEKVGDPLFADSEFFDPRDLLQVRYEMVRRSEEASLRETAERFGASVPTCVRANRAFREGGLQALIPLPRGPRGAHKITPEILAFVEECRARHGSVGSRKLVPLIAERFGVTVHPRGLEKARARAKKTRSAGHDAMAGCTGPRTLLLLAPSVESEPRDSGDRHTASSRHGAGPGAHHQRATATRAVIRRTAGARPHPGHARGRRHGPRPSRA